MFYLLGFAFFLNYANRCIIIYVQIKSRQCQHTEQIFYLTRMIYRQPFFLLRRVLRILSARKEIFPQQTISFLSVTSKNRSYSNFNKCALSQEIPFFKKKVYINGRGPLLPGNSQSARRYFRKCEMFECILSRCIKRGIVIHMSEQKER